MAEKKKSPVRRETWIRLLSYLKKSIPVLVLTILFAAATVALSLYIPILCGRAIDGMIGEGRADFERILHPAM